MPVYQLNEHIAFPPIDHAENDGLLGIGGDLSSERLIIAYESGIFPWYSENQPILWWSPEPRFVLYTDKVHVSRSMRRIINSGQYSFSMNESFESVIDFCSRVPREGQEGTWITKEMINAYKNLHAAGLAWSFETWENKELVGGMYGVKCKNYFAGESMFSLKSNASKFALINACNHLQEIGVKLLDCQMHSEHLERMGAEYISRNAFKDFLTIKSELR